MGLGGLLTDQLLESLPNVISKIFCVIENPAENSKVSLKSCKAIPCIQAVTKRVNANPKRSHADVDVERMVANLSSHVHVALAVLLHADVGIGGKMIIVALECS